MTHQRNIYVPGETHVEEDYLWYKDAIIYELHVRAFRDHNGDGIGDFKGLIEKLDYLYDLGVTAIWLLPFYPSPLKDDGYDISDYLNVNVDYGTLRDFREFLKAAHKKGIRVIAELVLNHTSSEHIWFQRARRAKQGTGLRDMYVWSNQADKYKDARIIFKDFEASNWSWDPVAQSYFWHRFYSHQPDLNFENPIVEKALFRAIDFWFSMGIDGLRLDAVPYLYEKDGTNCENLQETHLFLRKLRSHVDSRFSNKMLLAEANQWPEDAVAYFGNGDECHMAFHFPLMPRMFMALQMEDCFPVVDILKSTPALPPGCQWATFLRNHDELTLEMVTDEERDYMYRVYARDTRAKINLGIRRRLAPLLSNSRRKIELMNVLLFSLPGTPIIYYGDEIGMGDNFYLGDRNGVRTPMQWGPDRNAGFSEANPHRLFLPVIIDPEYHFETINVRNQIGSFSSLLWWMRGIIAMRRRFRAFSRGDLEILPSDNSKILSFCRRYEDELILVIVNLSRFSQLVHIDMPQYSGLIPEEVFGKTIFPIIKDTPYMLTIGPYDHYWLLLGKNSEEIGIVEERIPAMKLKKNWESIFSGKARQILEEKLLSRYLMHCRWFASKSRKISKTTIIEEISLNFDSTDSSKLLIIKVNFTEGADENYLLPVAFEKKTAPGGLTEQYPQAVISELLIDDQEGVLYDGMYNEKVHQILFAIINGKKRIKGLGGELVGVAGRNLKAISENLPPVLLSHPLKVEQSNTAIVFDETFFMKLYRKLEEGTNPELEILQFLSDEVQFTHIPLFAGAIEYRSERTQPQTVAIMQGYVENSGNAWSYTLGVIARFFEQVLSDSYGMENLQQSFPSLFLTKISDVPAIIRDKVGELFLEMISLLGKRSAQMHKALSLSQNNTQFDPESFSQLYQRSLYQSMQGLVQRTFQSLDKNIKTIPENYRSLAEIVLENEGKVLEIMKKIVQRKITSTKIRIHGDYHLGQVLYTGKDFVIMDFEGEPARPLSERKLKRSPFKDVAGMIRSFHYSTYSTLLLNPTFRQADFPQLESWISPLYNYISGVFLESYLKESGDASFVPRDNEQIIILLQIFLLEKAVYELGYEMNNRPEWVIIPLRGIQSLLKDNKLSDSV
ncbi:MAG TPA: maltose alpha-D-glucosyltransferase [Chitinispirillaceae bacterium]|nr:maltose alpha-D-glucosyltransferase [Chitinispirillaceae bacterium]